MWPVLYSTVGLYTIFSSEMLTKAVSISISGLTNSLALMAMSDANSQIKNYKEELELMDIELKLKLVENWLKNINISMIKTGSNMDYICRTISESCHHISYMIYSINEKIQYHNTLWFRNWRSISLDIEINKLKKYVSILNDRLIYIAISRIWESNDMTNDDISPGESIDDLNLEII